jgi:nitrite reductase (NADH) small subunit
MDTLVVSPEKKFPDSQLTASSAPMADVAWVDVCALEDVLPGTGVAAMVGAEQVALLRSRDGKALYAISNFDPFSRAFVLARGIVGDRGGVPKVASPIYKQNFDLLTGRCLDDPKVCLPIYPVRLRGSRVEIGARSGEAR